MDEDVIGMDKDELLERYEALGEEADFLAAKPLFEREVAERPDPILLRQYGYLLECHGRYSIRRAIEQYERSIALDPDAAKVRHQWISAKASMHESEDAIAVYRDRVAAAPGNVAELRFLASAYLSAGDIDAAAEVIERGLAVDPQDWALIGNRGEVKKARGDVDGALADWRRAHELEPEDFSTVYSSAFLLEREGRLAEAVAAWRLILETAEAEGWELTAAWPRQEIARLEGLLAGPGR
jgi:tetratricopeptide (TPR) repeat protein